MDVSLRHRSLITPGQTLVMPGRLPGGTVRLRAECPAYQSCRPCVTPGRQNSSMDSGVAAVMGAAVGVVGTTLAAAVAGISAQRQIRSEHRHWRRQLRRDAYSAFTAKADELHKALKEINAGLIAPGADLDVLREGLGAARGLLHGGLADAQATVEIEGPEKLARMAEELSRSLSACLAAISAATLGQGAGRPSATTDSQGVRRFLDHALSKRTQFVEHARRTIDV